MGKVLKTVISPFTRMSTELVKLAGLEDTGLMKIADPIGMFTDKASRSGPTVADEIKTTTGIGAVGEGGTATFDESEIKRKSIRKKKVGAGGLQIPLQSTSTNVTSGISGTTSGTGGLQI